MIKKAVSIGVFCVASASAMDFDKQFDENRDLIERALHTWTERNGIGAMPEYRGNIVYKAVLEQFSNDLADWFVGHVKPEDEEGFVARLHAMAKFLAGERVERTENPVWTSVAALECAKKNPDWRGYLARFAGAAVQKIPSFLNENLRPYHSALNAIIFKCTRS